MKRYVILKSTADYSVLSNALYLEIPFEIPEIKTKEDAYEYMKHWHVYIDEQTWPICICNYCVVHKDDSIEPKYTQIFMSTEIGAPVNEITAECKELANRLVERESNLCPIAVFRTYATKKNVDLFYDAYMDMLNKIELQEDEKLLPIPMKGMRLEDKSVLLEKKTHNLPFEMIESI